MTTIAELAADARPVTEEDWGTERQIDAQNAFGDAFEALMGDTPGYDDFCLGATTDEILDEGLRLVEEKFGTRDVEVPAPSTPAP